MKLDRSIHEDQTCRCKRPTLRDLADRDDGGFGPIIGGCGSIARVLYEERRRRSQYFEERLFAEPAWDMLLDLRIQADSGRLPSVSSACIGSAAPASTALRHLVALEDLELVSRRVDPQDARRKLTELTAEGAQRLDSYLADLASGWSAKQDR